VAKAAAFLFGRLFWWGATVTRSTVFRHGYVIPGYYVSNPWPPVHASPAKAGESMEAPWVSETT
ncbi:MAG: hypothetical protein J0G97_02800, partial [Rhizobium pusense]|nr:hypothetical protein [Agrobacterium pusense]